MNQISTLEVKRMMDEKAQCILLDCRGVDYYLWERIPEALNIRWKYIEDKAEQRIPDKKTTIITHCDGFTCHVSSRCYQRLSDLGYTNLLEYSGGIADWKAHGYETIRDPNHRLADNVYRFPDQSFYGEQVGSYLIAEKDFVLLIDGPQQLTDEHDDFIVHFNKPIKIFMTHHSTGGESEKLQKKYKAEIYLHKDDKDGEWLTAKPDHLIEDEFSFSDRLTVVHTPGHSIGSSVLYDKRNRILFTGDTIEGDKHGRIHNFMVAKDGTEGDKKKRFESAKKLLDYDFDKIFPFHYQMILRDSKKTLAKFVKSNKL